MRGQNPSSSSSSSSSTSSSSTSSSSSNSIQRLNTRGRTPIRRIAESRRRRTLGRAVGRCVESLEARRLLSSTDFTQAANGDASHSPPLGDDTWLNGILNPNNSEYFEGVSTLQRILLSDVGTTTGDAHTLTFNHDAAKGTAHSYDFLTSWAQAVAAAAQIAPGTLLNPDVDGPDADSTVEAFEPGSSSPSGFTTTVSNLYATGTIVDVSIPDTMGTVLGDNVATRVTAYEGFFGNRTIRIYANAPVSTAPGDTFITFDGYTGSDAQANYTLHWKSAATTVLVEFGAHLSQGEDFTLTGVGYGAGKGAGSVSGGPYHVGMAKLDGDSTGAQDNQIQANAVAAPPSFTIDKNGDLLGKVTDDAHYTVTIVNNGTTDLFPQSISDSLAGTLAASSFTESGANDNVLNAGETWTLNYTYTVQANDPDPLINTVTATFDTQAGLNGIEVTHSAQHTVNLFQPKIDLEKSANKTDAAVGDSVTYTYTLQNTGSSDSPALSIVSLIDDNGTPAVPGDDFTPTFVSGDTNTNSKLDIGETWTYTKTHTIPTGATDPYVNTAVVHANPVGFTNDITDTDTASVNLFAAAVHIVKTGTLLSKIGDPVTYNYAVTNTGSADSPALENVVVTDDNATPANTADDFHPTFVSGDTNGDGFLDHGETWTYTKTLSVPAGASDPYVNIATVTAKAVGSDATANDTDTHSVNLFQPAIHIVKIASKLFAAVGDSVTYNYSLTNTGSSDSPALVLVSLIDDNATPANTGDDFTPTFVSGDTDGDGKLDIGETWTYTNTHTIPAGASDPYVNKVVVHANPDGGFTNDITDDDTASVNLFQPAIHIVKSGTTLSKIGDPVTYNYAVTNTGSTDSPALENVVVTDDNATPGDISDDFHPAFVGGDTNTDGKLDKTETWTYTKTLNVPAGASDPYVNIAVVTAKAVGSDATVNDTDTHSVNLFQPAIHLVKQANRSQAAVGDTITYSYTLTNTGSNDSPALVLVSFKDDNGTPGSTGDDFTPTFVSGDTDGDGKLDLGETWTYSSQRVVLVTDGSPLVNTAVVHANPDGGFSNDIHDDDTASVALFVPSIHIVKSGTTLSKIGDPVTYNYAVTNTSPTGSPALENVVVTDDDATPGNTGDDFNPSFVGGDTNTDGKLDLGETWTYTKTLNVPAGASDPYVNIATVTASVVGSVATVNDTDTHSVNLFQPAILIVKNANRSQAAVGDTITYSYTLTNTGSSDSPALVLVSLIDDNGTPGSAGDDFTPTFVGGDTDGDGKLDLNETWTYTASRIVNSNDSDPLVNTVVVHANPDGGFTNDITDDDTASVALFTPTIDLVKSGTELSKIGDPVTYSYAVTNTSPAGSPALQNVVLTDDNGTPADTSDDFNPTFTGGDTNTDGKLDIGETWTYTKSMNVPAGASDPFVNVATVTASVVGSVATVNDTDNHSVNLFQPGITLTKALKSGTPLVGNTLVYTITITNHSSDDSPDLIPDSIVDTKIGAISASLFNESGTDDNRLEKNEVWTVDVNYIVQAADSPSFTNTAVAHFHPDGFTNDIHDDDSVSLQVEQPPHITGRMTGGGSIFLKTGMTGGPVGTRVTHGFELHCDITRNNRLEINWGKPNNHFHLLDLDFVECSDNPIIQAPPDAPIDTLHGIGHGLFTGTFNGHKYNRVAARVEFVFTDGGPLKGEPGIFDTASYEVRLLSNNLVVLSTDGPDAGTVPDPVLLTFGNHQAHKENGPARPTLAAQQIHAQLTQVLNQLDNAKLTEAKAVSLVTQLLGLEDKYEALI